MIKKVFSIIGFLTVSFLLLAASLSCSTEKITASLGQEFTLYVGKTVNIGAEDLSIMFVEVDGDSRCPTGVQCVWAGEAKCRMSVKYQGSSSELVFTQLGGNTGTQNLFNQYKVSFKLEPYPEYGKQIDKSDYRMVMTVTK
jgi:hypothetical protein